MSAEEIVERGLAQCLKAQHSDSQFIINLLWWNDSTWNHQPTFNPPWSWHTKLYFHQFLINNFQLTDLWQWWPMLPEHWWFLSESLLLIFLGSGLISAPIATSLQGEFKIVQGQVYPQGSDRGTVSPRVSKSLEHCYIFKAQESY